VKTRRANFIAVHRNAAAASADRIIAVMPRRLTLDDLRRFAVGRSLFAPTTLTRAIDKLAFVQADPIRAPARAQDLTLRHRVRGYTAGDLERRYASLAIEEDVFINYGFLPRSAQALMHPRGFGRRTLRQRRVQSLLEFVRARGTVHPREVDAHFAHGTVTNYWGGSSSATTHLLEHMHYGGLLRVARRDGGIRLYALAPDAPPAATAAMRRQRLDALVDVAVRAYAPVPARALAVLVRRLRYAVPDWRGDLTGALQRARARLAQARVDGVDWYWPAGERVTTIESESVRLLAPFDPIVWDRGRFETFWGWAYRFEAYTPVAKRKLGYYALPLLWREHVVGWGNVAIVDGALDARVDCIQPAVTRDPAFRRELDAELDRMRAFLGLREAARDFTPLVPEETGGAAEKPVPKRRRPS
jgi:uncharacterized protein YcaQ